MRYFTLLDFQHMILAFCIGLLAVIFVIVAWWQYPPQDEECSQDIVHAAPSDKSHSIPPILIFIIVSTLLGAVGYLIVVGVYGGAIS